MIISFFSKFVNIVLSTRGTSETRPRAWGAGSGKRGKRRQARSTSSLPNRSKFVAAALRFASLGVAYLLLLPPSPCSEAIGGDIADRDRD